jgi:hypothetical protein
MDFLKQFGGAELLNNANSSALKTMESGFASLVGANLHTKTKGDRTTHSVKIEFNALAPKQDGIDDYIRTSRANELAKAINKYKYLFIHSDNADARKAFNELPLPFEAYTQEVDVVQNEGTEQETVVKEIRAIDVKSLKEDLPKLRALHGEELDFIFPNSDKDSVAKAVKVINHEVYCTKLAEAINLLKGSTYRLKITAGKNNFDQVSTITKANM